jgi:hypothetical protein
MLGDWCGDKLNNQFGYSVRFIIEQSTNNSAYIHYLTNLFNNWGYCSYIIPKLIKKSDGKNNKQVNKSIPKFNYRLTLFTFSSLVWIYDSFYCKVDGSIVKKVPDWIESI